MVDRHKTHAIPDLGVTISPEAATESAALNAAICVGPRAVKRAISVPEVLNEAHAYARPSSFSRGVRLEFPGATMLFLSGTASIDEHGATLHEGDFAPSACGRIAISRACSNPRARTGGRSSGPPATCATSNATMRPSTTSALGSSATPAATRCRRAPPSRRDCAEPISSSRSRRSP